MDGYGLENSYVSVSEVNDRLFQSQRRRSGSWRICSEWQQSPAQLTYTACLNLHAKNGRFSPFTRTADMSADSARQTPKTKLVWARRVFGGSWERLFAAPRGPSRTGASCTLSARAPCPARNITQSAPGDRVGVFGQGRGVVEGDDFRSAVEGDEELVGSGADGDAVGAQALPGEERAVR